MGDLEALFMSRLDDQCARLDFDAVSPPLDDAVDMDFVLVRRSNERRARSGRRRAVGEASMERTIERTGVIPEPAAKKA